MAKLPQERRSLLSMISYAWLWPMVWKGYFTTLQETDTPLLPTSFGTARVGEKAKRFWGEELQREKPSILRVLWRVCRGHLVAGCLVAMLQGFLNVVLRPLMLRVLIQRIQSGESDLQGTLVLLAVFVTVLVIEALATSVSRIILSDNVGAKLAASLGVLIQSKAAMMPSTAVIPQDESVMVGADIVRTTENLKYYSQAPSVITGLLGAVVLVYMLAGPPGIIGLVFLFANLGLNMRLSNVTKKLEAKNLAAADRRVKTVKQVVDGIKATKFMAWETPYMQVITSQRLTEVKCVRAFRLFQACANNLGRANPILSSGACFVGVALAQGAPLSPEMVFATLTVFQSLRLPLVLVPIILVTQAQFKVSMARIQSYLLLEVGPGRKVLPSESPNAVVLQGASLQWPATERPVMKDINLEVPKGSLTAIVGAVGSGKTTLLTSVLGELQCTGFASSLSSLAYIPQKPFVLSGRLKDNILMGSEFDDDKYMRALEFSMLRTDIDNMADGDDTEIGERGVTLSGGQQQRLGIARALYRQPDLMLADDCLAAVDGRVGAAIFEKAFRRRAQGSTVLMSINQLHFLNYFDQVVFLADGEIKDVGTYKELLGRSTLFQAFVRTGPSTADLDAAELPGQTDDKASAGQPSGKASRKEGAEKASHTLTKKEAKQDGAIQVSVAKRYVKAMGARSSVGGHIVCASAYGLLAFGDQWLAQWIKEVKNSGDSADTSLYIGIYIGIVLGYVCLILCGTWLFVTGCARAGTTLHSEVLDRILHAPMSWFEATPSGRILSRFSADLSMVDTRLIEMVDTAAQLGWNVIVYVVVIVVVVPYVIPALILGAVVFWVQYQATDRCAREVKRYANNAMSPIMTNLAETGRARALIRTMGYESFFHSRHCRFFDAYLCQNYAQGEVLNLGMLMSSLISSFIATATATVLLFLVGSFDPTMAALALTYSYLMPYFIMMMSAVLGMTKLCLACLERILEYSGPAVAQEAAWEVPEDKHLPASWPSTGAVSFRDVTLVYREGLPPALRGVSFEIAGGEHVGIVGRTGAGKSSLMVLLFRLSEAASGEILVDGQNIALVGLQTLRQRLSVVPQEPLLMEGTVRKNLDPFGLHQEAELLEVLCAAGLGPKILDVEVGAGGRSVSAGEAQLVSIARTLLRRTRVVVMDEPTSNIDAKTDEVVQTTVRTAFAGATLLTIAHRLETIIDSDRILVMEAGRVVENGHPADLVSDPASHLSSMVAAVGTLEKRLRQKALQGSPASRKRQRSSNVQCGDAACSIAEPHRTLSLVLRALLDTKLLPSKQSI